MITLDVDLSIRDLYFPYVGMENHVGGHRCRFGVWVDGRFSWIDEHWRRSTAYRPDSLVSEVVLTHPVLPVELRISDTVHPLYTIFLRGIAARSTDGGAHDLRLFFAQDFHVHESSHGVTALYHPQEDAVIHYRKDRYILAGARGDGPGLDQYAVGTAETRAFQGTWVDAEDGTLSRNPVAHGSVDSTIGVHARLEPNRTSALHYWLCTGTSMDDVIALHRRVREAGAGPLLDQADRVYRVWVNKSAIDFADVSPVVVDAFKRSLLVLRTQIDNRGAILGSCDSDIYSFNHDSYAYAWPRDGAFVSIGLDAAGYYGVTRRFFRFCERTITPAGYLFHKYHPDGTLGSTWHPWIDIGGAAQYPIQEDETALVLYALWNHYDRVRDIEFVISLYDSLVIPAAEFLVRYRDPGTHLPLPSYDLWEEQHGIFSFTVAAVFAGLLAASRIAALLGDTLRVARYREAADEVKAAALALLVEGGTGRFFKAIRFDVDGSLVPDRTVDASAYGIYAFGLLPPGDPRVHATMEAVEARLGLHAGIGGVARYEMDRYQRDGDDPGLPGNPWPICTLWLAEWYIGLGDLPHALRLLEWVCSHATRTGLMPEQLNPLTGAPLSVSPLTWSHSTFVLTVTRYLDAVHGVRPCPTCGLSSFKGSHARPWI
ncbi:MAG: glycoside hydrolase family 15 protein [Methanospirillum sp.]